MTSQPRPLRARKMPRSKSHRVSTQPVISRLFDNTQPAEYRSQQTCAEQALNSTGPLANTSPYLHPIASVPTISRKDPWPLRSR